MLVQQQSCVFLGNPGRHQYSKRKLLTYLVTLEVLMQAYFRLFKIYLFFVLHQSHLSSCQSTIYALISSRATLASSRASVVS